MYNNFFADQNTTAYNSLKAQFDNAMQRESKVITKYFDKTEIPVLFRRNSDRNTTENRTTIFYYANADLQQGQLVQYKNDTYIVWNQETAENDVYFRSDLIKCNTSISAISNGMELHIPVFVGDILDGMPDQGNVLTTLKGYSQAYTEDCEFTRNLKIDTSFELLGGTYAVKNIVLKDGLSYIYVERTASASKEYTISINPPDTSTFEVGSGYTFTATCKFGIETVSNATLKWTSSNPAVATINDNGQALFIGVGSVSFACLWMEHNRTDTNTISVTEPQTKPAYQATISGRGDLKIGGSARTYTASFKNSDGEVVELSPVWSFECSNPQLNSYITLKILDNGSCTLLAENNDELIGETVTLKLADTTNLCSVEKVIEIVML